MTSPDAGAGRGAGDGSDVGAEPAEPERAAVAGAGRSPAVPTETEPAVPTETETEPAASAETEPAASADRAARAAGPLLPEQSPEDTDAAWGEYPQSARDRLYRDRPPHWNDF
jgi:hypothetical protein